jgi:hypothetical protein
VNEKGIGGAGVIDYKYLGAGWQRGFVFHGEAEQNRCKQAHHESADAIQQRGRNC